MVSVSRYIDVDKIKWRKEQQEISYGHNDRQYTTVYRVYKSDIERVPTADVAPVVHGKWEKVHYGYDIGYDCSVCGKGSIYQRRSPYCPNCGAKMDERSDKE